MAAPDGFTWTQRKNGDVVISHRGRQATTLRGRRAADFLGTVNTATVNTATVNTATVNTATVNTATVDGDSGTGQSSASDQELMARLTGNYKRGNERTARNHPRNQQRR